MKKDEQIARLAEATGFTKKDTGLFLDAFATLVQEATAAGEQPKLGDLGYFDASYRAARTGRNPRKPGEEIDVPETAAPVFRASKAFKKALAKPEIIARVKAE
jgi:DNA-binding protein HU-beta